MQLKKDANLSIDGVFGQAGDPISLSLFVFHSSYKPEHF